MARHGPDDQHRMWERIAHSFDLSRVRTWPHVEGFIARLPRPPPAGPGAGLLVLDLMAGNGRHVRPILEAGHRALWLDWSRPAARIARSRYPAAAAVVGDATRLPLRDASVDACILVAGLHSLPTRDGRLACLRELWRVLRPGAPAQVTVWSRDAPRFRDQGTPGEPLDLSLPWKSHGHDEERHYHLYTPAELRLDLAAAGLALLREEQVAVVSKTGPDNLVAEVRRPPSSPS